MIPKRYSLIIGDRASGMVHRFTVPVRSTLAVIAAILALPVGWSVQSRWGMQAEVERLQLLTATLQIENASYRAAATELTTRIGSLRTEMSNLATRSELDPRVARAVEHLPTKLRAAALGEAVGSLNAVARASPLYAFDLLRDLLASLDQRLQVLRNRVARREQLVEATPISWPADGWLSATFGYRRDPFTGEREFHPAIDISSDKGLPVTATASGRVVSAARSGAYGNLVEINHGFGLVTRYGHLSAFAVRDGDSVKRGDVIGYVGATGRATGYHVHYEVWAEGRPINPLRLVAEARFSAAN